jgi:hypothetical protein
MCWKIIAIITENARNNTRKNTFFTLPCTFLLLVHLVPEKTTPCNKTTGSCKNARTNLDILWKIKKYLFLLKLGNFAHAI